MACRRNDHLSSQTSGAKAPHARGWRIGNRLLPVSAKSGQGRFWCKTGTTRHPSSGSVGTTSPNIKSDACAMGFLVTKMTNFPEWERLRGGNLRLCVIRIPWQNP